MSDDELNDEIVKTITNFKNMLIRHLKRHGVDLSGDEDFDRLFIMHQNSLDRVVWEDG
jgi:hypothetical protein